MPPQRTSRPPRVAVLIAILIAGVIALVVAALVAGLAWYGTDRTAAQSPQSQPSPQTSQVSPSTEGVPSSVTGTGRKLADLAYGKASAAQKLDLYLPQQAQAGQPGVPLVVNVHGGGWEAGDKADLLDVWNVDALNASGIAVASMNYRLSGEAKFPAGVQDVKGAIRWLRANAATYHLDPRRIALSGTSAGGNIAALVGVTGSLTTEFDGGDLGNDGQSSAVLAVVDVSGVTDMLTMDTQTQAQGCDVPSPLNDLPDSPEAKWLGFPIQTRKAETARAGPITYLSRASKVPPFYLLHGTADCLVPDAQARQFERALKRAGVPVTLRLVDGAGHAVPDLFLTGGPGAVDFLRKVLLK